MRLNLKRECSQIEENTTYEANPGEILFSLRRAYFSYNKLEERTPIKRDGSRRASNYGTRFSRKKRLRKI